MEQVAASITNVLILSSMYILVALGFVFVFNMLGILNFAHGAVYMIGGYFGFELAGRLGLNTWLALALSTIAVAAFGVVLEKFCFRRFVGDFNRIIMVCVAITIVLQTSVNIMEGGQLLALPQFVKGVFKAGPVTVSYQRILTFAIGASFLAAILWFVNCTKWGQQMKAIAQNMEGALLQGINVGRISAIVFALGSGLAAIAGCLMGAYLMLGPFMGDFMLVKVLILAILAGVGSIGGIFITGLVLGGLDAVLPVLVKGVVSDAIGVAIVVALLLVRPQGFFGHEAEAGSDARSSEPTASSAATGGIQWAKPVTWMASVLILSLLPLFISSPYILHLLILTFIYVVASVSLRTITISGQFPLAHGAFMGIGAYSAGMASRWLGLPPWITIPGAALITMGLGVFIGLPFARLRTLYYAMGSLFFGIGVIQIIIALGVWTGGNAGLYGIRPIFTTSKVSYYYFFLALGVICMLALYRLEFCRIGKNLKAIAQSHTVASSVGMNEGLYRIMVVGVGCFFAGISGACYAHYNMVISSTSFGLAATLWLFMYVLVGGVDRFEGPIVGTFVLFLIPEFFRDLKVFSPFVSAVILLIVAYLMPRGLVALPGTLKSLRRERREARSIIHAS